MKSNLPVFRHLLAAAAIMREAEGTDGGAAAAPAVKSRAIFTPEQIKEIRELRAQVHPEGHEKAGKPVWSHLALSKQFDTTAGGISQIVRNRTYKDPEYVPVNDGN